MSPFVEGTPVEMADVHYEITNIKVRRMKLEEEYR